MTTHEAAPAPPLPKEVEKLSYVNNPTGIGYLLTETGVVHKIAHTPDNDVLILHNKPRDRFEIVYQSSGLVSEMLLGLHEMQTNLREDGSNGPQWRMKFFDKHGRFYDEAKLRTLDPLEHKNGVDRHQAVFEIPSGARTSVLSIEVGDIYSLAVNVIVPLDIKSSVRVEEES